MVTLLYQLGLVVLMAAHGDLIVQFIAAVLSDKSLSRKDQHRQIEEACNMLEETKEEEFDFGRSQRGRRV